MSAPDIRGLSGGRMFIGTLTTSAAGAVASSTGSIAWTAPSAGTYLATFPRAFDEVPVVVVDSPLRDRMTLTTAVNSCSIAVAQEVIVQFPLADFREVDANADVANLAGVGGILASDSTPILRGSSAESFELAWAAGNSDIVAAQVTLPADFSGAQDLTVEAWVFSGTTDAANIKIETGWDNAALVSDDLVDTATKSATLHRVTATIAKADVPDAARNLTIILTPPTHATDAIVLRGLSIMTSNLLISQNVSMIAAQSYVDDE